MNSTGKRRRQAADFPGANTILKQLKEKPKRKRVGFLSTGPPARGIQFITVRKRSCGKIMFSLACVQAQARGGGGLPREGVQAQAWGVSARGGAQARRGVQAQARGGWVLRPRGCVSQHALRHTPLADGYCCGRYASYWNAFLFRIFFQRMNI